MKRILIVMAALLALGALLPLGAEEATEAKEEKPMATINDLAWLSGSWIMDDGQDIVEEITSPPRGNMMVATCRFIRDGRTWLLEFVTIEEREDGIFIFLKHFGPGLTDKHADPMVFKLVESEEHRALFKNQVDSFPQEWEYRMDGETLVAEIRGTGRDGTPRSEVFRYEPVE